jgi:hypothetical protein
MKKKNKPGQDSLSAREERPPRRWVGLGISAAVIGALLIAGTIWVEKIKGSYTQAIEDTHKSYASLSNNAKIIENTKQQRADYFRKRLFADFPSRYSYGTADFIRRLSLIAAQGIELTELQIQPLSGGQDFSFTLNGSITADDNINARAKFLRFYLALKTFEDMMQITYSNTREKGASTASRQTTKLFFEINGQVELI